MGSRILSFLILLLLFTPGTYGQNVTNSPEVVPDLTENFVGDWVGTNQHLDNGAIVTEPVELKVTETRIKNYIRFDYTFGKKNRKGFRENVSVFLS